MAQARVKNWHKLAEASKDRAAREMADAEENAQKQQKMLATRRQEFEHLQFDSQQKQKELTTLLKDA